MGQSSSSAERDDVVRRRLGRFGADHGLGAEPPLVAEVVEAFVVKGLAGRASSTRGTYRSVLRHLGGAPRPPAATPFAASPAPAPYTGPERAELFCIASSQRSAERRRSALAALALGVGAGLRAGEIASVVGPDVTAAPRGVSVRVAGAPGRAVAVAGTYAGVISELASWAGDGFLFCPGATKRSYKNLVNNFARNLEADPGAPRFSSGRARSSFICDHLGAGAPLAVLLYMAGIVEVESLLRYARHVPRAPKSKAELRAKLAER